MKNGIFNDYEIKHAQAWCRCIICTTYYTIYRGTEKREAALLLHVKLQSFIILTMVDMAYDYSK